MRELWMVAAVAKNGVIGRDGALPWSLPEDLRFFRSVTTGHTIIMGRKTHESIGRALPNRRNIVVTRDSNARFEGCETAPDLATALALAYAADDAPRVIGGAMLYEAAMPLATDLVLTEIDHEVEGDVSFPAWDRGEFECVESRAAETAGVSFVRYRRRMPGA